MHHEDANEVRSAIDAVRCLYLARIVEQRGHHQAARRWQARAMKWMQKIDTVTLETSGASGSDTNADGSPVPAT